MKPKNLKEFKALIKRYESITLEEIKRKNKNFLMKEVAYELTGFGSGDTCILCKNGCSNCIYTRKHKFMSCTKDKNSETYYNLRKAKNSKKLLNAFRARAKHMKTILKTII